MNFLKLQLCSCYIQSILNAFDAIHKRNVKYFNYNFDRIILLLFMNGKTVCGNGYLTAE